MSSSCRALSGFTTLIRLRRSFASTVNSFCSSSSRICLSCSIFACCSAAPFCVGIPPLPPSCAW
eukprot:CAMPEP_0206159388 /NCGR_PEP_ID=MMETSP1474-20131121/5767_1 /ASSEMBLY_ACC=CAM_ASM_001110 /TAXON_ID=97495 /ORGANISM="Imantonia sp., Strain RCC918" /LENGTH=63 /DNA_ID=CAMNT_0053560055 /DNA_START=551 /DNA_END=739 /DNA_ORIENTATION=-